MEVKTVDTPLTKSQESLAMSAYHLLRKSQELGQTLNVHKFILGVIMVDTLASTAFGREPGSMTDLTYIVKSMAFADIIRFRRGDHVLTKEDLMAGPPENSDIVIPGDQFLPPGDQLANVKAPDGSLPN